MSSKNYVYIDGWKSNIRFSAAHVIPEYEKCGRLHGHTYAAHVKVFGEPDEKGIIIDFTILKDNLKIIIEDLDHKILIPEKSSCVSIKKNKDLIEFETLGKKYILPFEDCFLLPLNSSTVENIAGFVLNELLKKVDFPDRISKIEIGVDEGFGQGARVVKKL
jgi:6-pyruvoyltetrahydropterin/6-carboxytetrahydropterin synthase